MMAAPCRRSASSRIRRTVAVPAWVAAPLAVSLLCSGCAQAPTRAAPPSAPEDYRDIGPRWSPTGDRIAFLRRWADGRAAVMVAAPDLSHPIAVTQPALLDPDVPIRTGRNRLTGLQQIAWSPDGRHLAYPHTALVEREETDPVLDTGLWEVDAGGGAPRPLAEPDPKKTQILTTYRSAAWSANGKWLAFVARGNRGETAITILPIGHRPRHTELLPRFDPYLDADLPTWSWDGRFLAFRRSVTRALTADPIERLRVIEPGGTQAQDILSLTPATYSAMVGAPASELAPRIAEIAWAPDNSRLAVTVVARAGSAATRDLWIVSRRGVAPPRRIPGSWIGAAWVDQRRLVALRRAPGGAFEAALLDAATGLARPLIAVPSDDMDWSPDRRSIVCAVPVTKGPAASVTLRVLRTGL